MTKNEKIEALRRLANDSAATEPERMAALNKIDELNVHNSHEISIQKESSANLAVLPSGKMPQWVYQIYDNPCPYESLVKKIESTFTHLRNHNEKDRSIYEDGFIIRTYGILGITRIEVSVGSKTIEIYSKEYAGGWRDGPWWSKLETVANKLIARKVADEAAELRKREQAALAKQEAENNLFADYLRQ